MEKRMKILIGIGIFVVFFIALTIKFSRDSDDGLNDYEKLEIIEEPISEEGLNQSQEQQLTEGMQSLLMTLIVITVVVTMGIIILRMIFNFGRMGGF